MSTACESCRTPDASTECEMCQNALCQDCVMRIEPGSFQYLTILPPELNHQKYCRFCFDQNVQPALDEYSEVLSRANDVAVFYHTQRKAIPLIRKSKENLIVESSPDRDETILKLAYQSAKLGFNAIIETTVTSEKVRHFGYQTSVWKGTAHPADIDSKKLALQDHQENVYR